MGDAAPEIWVELSSLEASPPSDDALSRLPNGAKPISKSGDLLTSIACVAGSDLGASMRAIAATVANAMPIDGPNSWSVEFGIAFKTGAGIPVIASGEASANLKVTLSWKS